MENVDLEGPEELIADAAANGWDPDEPIDRHPIPERGSAPSDDEPSRGKGLLIAAIVVALAVIAAVVAVTQRGGDDDDGVEAGDPSSSSVIASEAESTEAAGTEESIGSAPVGEEAAEGAESAAGAETGESDGTESPSSTLDLPATVDRSNAPISVVGMSSLSNVRLRTNRAAYRFTADRTGEIESMRLYFIVNTSRSGYAAGTGGTINVTVAPENSEGMPDEDRLLPGRFEATFGLVNGAFSGEDRGQFIKDSLLGGWQFSEPLSVEAGESYFIIFENADPSPANNFVSLDLVIDLLPDALAGGPPIPSPARRTDFAFFEDREGQDWFQADTHSSGHWRTPIFQVEYADGATQGQGFMQYQAGNAFELSGTSAIRTTIRLDHDRTISELAARVGAHPTGSVILELATLDGEVLRSVTGSANGTANYRNAVWVEGTVEPLTLEADTDYALVVRPGSGYSGTVIPLQAGLTYGYSPDSVFPFGRAQTSPDGQNWTDWRSGLFYQSISVK